MEINITCGCYINTNLSIVSRSKLITSHSSINRNVYNHYADTIDDTDLPTETQIIKAAKQVMQNTGYFNEYDSTLFADDFIFRGPVIGPLCERL